MITTTTRCLSIGLLLVCTQVAHAVEQLYVATNHEVRTYDLAGVLLSQFAVDDSIEQIAVNRYGQVFVLSHEFLANNSLANHVDRYAADGQHLGRILSVPTTNSNFLGMSIGPDELLWIGVNGLPDAIDRYTQSGAFVDRFATISTGPPGAPFEIEFDSANRVYVPDQNLIEYFAPSGMSLGTFATVDPNFYLVVDVAIDSRDNVYALNLAAFEDDIDMYERFDPDGNSLGLVTPALGTFESIWQIEIDSSDTIYLGINTGTGFSIDIRKYAPDGTPLGTLVAGLQSSGLDLVIRDVVPEPGSGILLALATGGLLWWRGPASTCFRRPPAAAYPARRPCRMA